MRAGLGPDGELSGQRRPGSSGGPDGNPPSPAPSFPSFLLPSFLQSPNSAARTPPGTALLPLSARCARSCRDTLRAGSAHPRPLPPRLDGSPERAPAGCFSFSRCRASDRGFPPAPALSSRPRLRVSPNFGTVSAALPRGLMNSGGLVPCDDSFFPEGFIIIIINLFIFTTKLIS